MTQALEFDAVFLERVISGGQTGADQGGLEAAVACGVPTGGTAPDGYKTVVGPAPWLADLGLTARGSYPERTRENIENSDATLVVAENFNTPGTDLTLRHARKVGRPTLCVHVNMRRESAVEAITSFIKENRVKVLNVAGNRGPRVQQITRDLLQEALQALRAGGLIRGNNG